jgi:hypothetical protein
MSPTNLSKSVDFYNKNVYVYKKCKVVKQQLICYRLNYNKNQHQFLTKVTNDCNKKTGALGSEALAGLLIENVHCTN